MRSLLRRLVWAVLGSAAAAVILLALVCFVICIGITKTAVVSIVVLVIFPVMACLMRHYYRELSDGTTSQRSSASGPTDPFDGYRPFYNSEGLS